MITYQVLFILLSICTFPNTSDGHRRYEFNMLAADRVLSTNLNEGSTPTNTEDNDTEGSSVSSVVLIDMGLSDSEDDSSPPDVNRNTGGQVATSSESPTRASPQQGENNANLVEILDHNPVMSTCGCPSDISRIQDGLPIPFSLETLNLDHYAWTEEDLQEHQDNLISRNGTGVLPLWTAGNNLTYRDSLRKIEEVPEDITSNESELNKYYKNMKKSRLNAKSAGRMDDLRRLPLDNRAVMLVGDPDTSPATTNESRNIDQELDNWDENHPQDPEQIVAHITSTEDNLLSDVTEEEKEENPDQDGVGNFTENPLVEERLLSYLNESVVFKKTREFPQLLTSHVGNCHYDKVPVLITPLPLTIGDTESGDPSIDIERHGCGLHVNVSEGPGRPNRNRNRNRNRQHNRIPPRIQGISMYMPWVRSGLMKKQCSTTLMNASCFADAVLNLMAGNKYYSRRSQTNDPESTYRIAYNLYHLLRPILGNFFLHHALQESKSVRLELTFCSESLLTTPPQWPSPVESVAQSFFKFIGVAQSSHMFYYFQSLMRRMVVPLDFLFREKRSFDVDALSAEAKTAYVYHAQQLVALVDPTRYSTDFQSTFIVQHPSEVPREMVRKLSMEEIKSTHLAFGLDPRALPIKMEKNRLSILSTGNLSTIEAANRYALSLAKTVHLPKKYMCAVDSFDLLLWNLCNSNQEQDIKLNNLSSPGLLAKINFHGLLDQPKKKIKLVLKVAGKLLNGLYDDIWSARIHQKLRRLNFPPLRSKIPFTKKQVDNLSHSVVKFPSSSDVDSREKLKTIDSYGTFHD